MQEFPASNLHRWANGLAWDNRPEWNWVTDWTFTIKYLTDYYRWEFGMVLEISSEVTLDISSPVDISYYVDWHLGQSQSVLAAEVISLCIDKTFVNNEAVPAAEVT